MRKALLPLLCLLVSSGCATGSAHFAPIGNCSPAAASPGSFSCVDGAGHPPLDAAGKPRLTPWSDAQDLVCFKATEFKAFNETCHSH